MYEIIIGETCEHMRIKKRNNVPKPSGKCSPAQTENENPLPRSPTDVPSLPFGKIASWGQDAPVITLVVSLSRSAIY